MEEEELQELTISQLRQKMEEFHLPIPKTKSKKILIEHLLAYQDRLERECPDKAPIKPKKKAKMFFWLMKFHDYGHHEAPVIRIYSTRKGAIKGLRKTMKDFDNYMADYIAEESFELLDKAALTVEKGDIKIEDGEIIMEILKRRYGKDVIDDIGGDWD